MTITLLKAVACQSLMHWSDRSIARSQWNAYHKMFFLDMPQYIEEDLLGWW